MPPVVRRLLALLLGVVVAVSVVSLADGLVARVWPLPTGRDAGDPARLQAALAAVPRAALLCLVLGWAVAAGAGAFVAVRLAPGRALAVGLVVVAFLLAATVANLVAIPHPRWMWPAALLAVPLVGWLGARLGTDTTRGAPTS